MLLDKFDVFTASFIDDFSALCLEVELICIDEDYCHPLDQESDFLEGIEGDEIIGCHWFKWPNFLKSFLDELFMPRWKFGRAYIVNLTFPSGLLQESSES